MSEVAMGRQQRTIFVGKRRLVFTFSTAPLTKPLLYGVRVKVVEDGVGSNMVSQAGTASKNVKAQRLDVTACLDR